MNSTEKKKINWLRLLRPIALALVLIFLLSYATYAWMKRDWSPKIHQENVQIAAGASLTFIFGDDEIDDFPINSLLNMQEFVFKSVSNCSGESTDFFSLNYSTQGEFYDTFNSVDETDLSQEELNLYADNKYTAFGRHFGYIELKFQIASDSEKEVFDKEIYLDGSYINGVLVENNESATELNEKAAEAIRISITVHGTGVEGDPDKDDATYIFARSATTHTGITNAHIDGVGFAADGAPRYDTTGENPVPSTIITSRHLPSEGIPLKQEKEIKTFDSFEDEYLFILDKGEQRTITVRIWLEGEDPNCENSIAGSALDLLLKFSAQNIIPENS